MKKGEIPIRAAPSEFLEEATDSNFQPRKSKRRGIMRYLTVAALGTTLAGAALVGATSSHVDYFDRTLEVNVIEDGQERTLDVPVFSIFNQRPNLCSAYARKVGNQVFDKEYSFSSAWNRRYDDKLVAEVENKTLSELAKDGILEPGMIIGARNPDSSYDATIDKSGNQARYTHVLTYLGISPGGEPLVVDQFHAKTQIRTESEMREAGLTPIEIIDERE